MAKTSTRTGVGRSTKRTGKKPASMAKISRVRKPEEMSLEQWQIALRRQFAQKQDFSLANLGGEPVFSEFLVTNPQSEGEYRVAIRGQGLGDNYCSCPDFAVNTLGTCKHIEWVLARLRRRRGGARALAEGFQPPYSEVYLRYGAQREVVFRPGTACPAGLHELAAGHFNAAGVLRDRGYLRFDTFLRRAGPSATETSTALGGPWRRC